MRCALFASLIAVLVALSAAQNAASLKTDTSRGVCFLRKDPGPCEAAIEKWFFNRHTKKCEKFIYGGCKGNRNRFDSEDECLKRCKPIDDVCKLKPDVGPCDGAFYRWFFNPKKGECEQFSYGGCGGNKNNFKTKAECQRACRKDCLNVNCFANPCEVTKCPAFPDADCVPDFCVGCDADFFVDGKLVDCKIEPPKCLPEWSRCVANPRLADSAVALKKCCPDTSCCACGPPVVREDFVPPKFGKCQKRCICPIG